MSDLKKENQFEGYENIPYFELVEIAEKEKDLEKRKTLFELSNALLERTFMKYVTQGER